MKRWIGKQFIKPFTKTGAKSVSKWKLDAANTNAGTAKSTDDATKSTNATTNAVDATKN